jgi:ssRNA-specific RNase YbeY (16S rRNA maturation enzyme)
MARLLYKKIKDDILGKDYELSLAFLSPKEMLVVTKKWKKKDHISNVLSFPLSKTSGEILICKEATAPFTPDYLFIHGLCHLKGYKHGATMENIERLYLKKWGINAHEQNNRRNRHRNLPR